MNDALQDLRYASRALRRAPGMSVVAIATLAVGVAAVSVIFSVVNSVFYRPLPFPDADRIVSLSVSVPGHYSGWSLVPLQLIDEIRRASRTFERIAAYDEADRILNRGELSQSIGVTAIDSSVLPLLRARAQRGRLITAEEIRSLATVAMISDSLWRRAYAATESIVGQTMGLNGVLFTIVGVLPAGYRFYSRSDILVPLAERPDSVPAADAHPIGLLGKLRTGSSLDQARRDVAQVGRDLAAADRQFRGWEFVVQDGMYNRGTGRGFAIYAWLFVGVTTCVLLIACTNVSNLMLVRAAERRPELAIRASLGASRTRLMRLVLTESLILGLAGGTVGTFLTVWGIRVLVALVPTAGLPSWIQLGVDIRVVGFTALLALLVVVAIGLAPALVGTRLDLVKSLKAGGEAMVTSGAVTRIGRRGIALEVALSVMLFVGAALLWRSYINMSSVDLGYPADRLLEPLVRLDRARYADKASLRRFEHALATRLEADARVDRVAIRGHSFVLDIDEAALKEAARKAALRGRSDRPAPFDEATGLYTSEDPATSIDRDHTRRLEQWAVSDSYFRTMSLSLVAGRQFDEQDQAGSSPVAVVSEAFARIAWRRTDVLGRVFYARRGGTPVTVVGVVRDFRSATSGPSGTRVSDVPSAYFSERQSAPDHGGGAQVIVRPRRDIAELVKAFPVVVRDVDPQAAVQSIETMAHKEERTLQPVRLFGIVLGALAVCALLLATIGTYGVVAYGVTLRTREIGLRIALGGAQAQVVGLFVRDGMRAIGAGLAIGVAVALGATQLLRSFLFGVSPFDVLTYAATLAFFGAVALLACWLPARRAARVQPIVALRGE